MKRDGARVTANRYSEESLRQISTCEDDLQRLFSKVLETWDHAVIEGHRSDIRQAYLFRTGASKLESGGKHNSMPSKGVDVLPAPYDWDAKRAFYDFALFVRGVAAGMGIEVRWGGDWDSDFDYTDQSFNDLVHWELIS